jgi:molecular chaperone GrpE
MPFSEEERSTSGQRPATPATAPRVAEDAAPPPGEPAGPPPEPEGPEAEGDHAGVAQPDAGAEEPPETHEQQLERDLDELAAKAQKADEYLELAQRTRADFENYRKRAAREAAAAQERGVVKLVRELLPAVDNLDRALDAVNQADPSNNGDLVSGIRLVHAEVIAGLARAGVERFDPAGERFDPARHEAVAQQEVEGSQPGTIVEVYQRGYRLGDSVIRPARVLVAS